MSENHPQSEQNTAPAQGQMYIPPQYYQAPEDEIDLRELFGVLWKGRWWIIGITALFAVASVFYALSLPNEYKATAIVAPTSSAAGGNIGGAAGQLGGLASLAGINLGGGESNDATIAMEIMKTWGFQEEFIKKHNLEVSMFAVKGWDQSENTLIFDDRLFDADQKKWIREAPKGKTVEPTSWELHENFSKNLSVTQDKDTGLISVSFIHYSPISAQEITSWLIKDVNELMKLRALNDSTKNIEYLEGQISRTALSGMKEVFYTLIEEQTKTKMLAEASDQYVFKSVSIVKLPEEKYGPNRLILIFIGIALGSLLSMLFILFYAYVRKEQAL